MTLTTMNKSLGTKKGNSNSWNYDASLILFE